MSSELASYLERPQPLPAWVWHAVRAASVAGALALVSLLFAEPRVGLIAWWLFVLPCVPLLLMLAPGIWRNACPMAALNQLPRLAGFASARTVPQRLARHTILIQASLYFALITLRAPLFDHDGPALGALMLVALVAAFAGGLAFKGKSGWCGTFCPLLPIQRLYGQTPALVVPNSHCATCVGCTTNCLDFNPELAVAADVHEGDAYRVGQLKVFAGLFPGFVVAFFTVPQSVVGAPANMGVTLASFYGLTALYMLASLGAFFLLDALAPVSPLVLIAAFGALGLNLHNILRFPTSFHVAKPAWVLGIEYVAVAAVSVQFVVRTHRKERRLAALAEREERRVAVRPHARDGHEVGFAPDGPRVVVAAGTPLLAAAERAGLPLEAGCRMGVCGSDPVAVLEGAESLTPATAAERSTLERLGLGAGCRLACSARVHGDLRVSLDVAAAGGGRAPRVAVPYDRSVRRVVVVGNGVAGTTAADHVRRRHPDCEIDLVAAEPHPSYNRMGISRLVYGRTAMQGLQLLQEEWYERNGVTAWLNTLARSLDRTRRELVLGTGERLAYDRLILATGAAARLPPLDGLDRPEVFVLRDADDALRVRAHVQRFASRRAVVVGGGLLGLEAAYALHRLGLRTAVVQRGPRLLDAHLDARAAELVARYFDGLGVEILLGAAPRGYDGRALALDGGAAVEADVLVVCAGIVPRTELARDAGLDVGRGVLVDAAMRTSDPLVFAAGDCAEHAGLVPGLWPVAVAQAEIAGANAVGDERDYAPGAPVALLKGVGLTVTAAGDVRGASGDEVQVDDPGGDDVRYRRVILRDGGPVGAILVGEWPDAAELVDRIGAAHSSAVPSESQTATTRT